MVCHEMGSDDLLLLTSEDSRRWKPGDDPVFMKKEFLLTDGTVWKPERVEVPFMLTDDGGKPQMFYAAVADKDVDGSVAIPMISTGEQNRK